MIKGGISDSNLSVSARSNVVRGQLDATAHRGIATFDSLVLTAPPGNYMVTFQGESIKSVEVCSHQELIGTSSTIKTAILCIPCWYLIQQCLLLVCLSNVCLNKTISILAQKRTQRSMLLSCLWLTPGNINSSDRILQTYML